MGTKYPETQPTATQCSGPHPLPWLQQDQGTRHREQRNAPHRAPFCRALSLGEMTREAWQHFWAQTVPQALLNQEGYTPSYSPVLVGPSSCRQRLRVEIALDTIAHCAHAAGGWMRGGSGTYLTLVLVQMMYSISSE